MRIKAKLTVEWEYEVHPKYYPDNSNDEYMLRIDKEAIEANPQEFVDLWEDVNVDLEIVGK